MIELTGLPLSLNILSFVVAAAVICYAGVNLSTIADELADRTGLGEIVAGALFVGASTSLPGAITSVSTAAQGFPELAIGNALGGLTAQTLFIAVADVFYRRANLEHAAATPVGMAQGLLLLVLLNVALIGSVTPGIVVFGFHPVAVLLPVTYVGGLFVMRQIHQEDMWKPKQTDETREEVSDPDEGEDERSDGKLWSLFAVFATLTALAGFFIGETSIALVSQLGVSQNLFGTTFTAIANSLPELVTAIAAVRIGAVSLAVGDIIGGNAFEVLFLSAADFASPDSLFVAMSPQNQMTALFAGLMVTVVLLGMLKRERSGLFNIGSESTLVFVLYAASLAILVF